MIRNVERHCQLGRDGVVLVRNGWLSWNCLRRLSLSAKPRKIAIATAGDLWIAAKMASYSKKILDDTVEGEKPLGLAPQI